MEKKFDFSGWATRTDVLCSDGRIIRKDAFKHCDGMKVPLFWNHQHNDVNEVLGHAILEHRDGGVYAYATFNDTPNGQTAKELVLHGDIDRLSIFANKLKEQGSNVMHGIIRELSLVVAGANPGAYIENVMAHADDEGLAAEIYTGYIDTVVPEEESLSHAETDEKGEKVAEETKNTTKDDDKEVDSKTVEELLKTLNDDQMKAVQYLVGKALESAKKEDGKKEDSVKHSDDADTDETVEDVIASMSPKQQKVFYAVVGKIIEESKNKIEHSEGGNEDMKPNTFDQDVETRELSHSEMQEIFADAKRMGSMREAVLKHGIEPIDMLFPDYKNLNPTPEFIQRDMTWVGDVMGGVHHTPFSRIKSVFADITEADARAKGYVKGNFKYEEMITLLKRETSPTTIYKKQKFDRDDLTDITGFEVTGWIKGEMRMMLNEEIARAILVGDGRPASSNDKINEQNLRPIWTDEEGFTVKEVIKVASNATADDRARAFIRACIKSRKNYKGSGNPTMYMSEDMLTDCLLLEDTNQRIIYDSMDKLKTALRVSKIVPVPVMENLTRQVGSKTHELAGIYVNLNDYNVGADKGGEINMFDDFDIDYNQQKFLIETRISGALTKPFSAVALEFVVE